jgi:hypothetical protein
MVSSRMNLPMTCGRESNHAYLAIEMRREGILR